MIFIFILSSFNANDSSSQSGFIVSIISGIFNINNIDILTVIVRKSAHFTEYFILGILVYNMLKNYNKSIYLGIIICFLYAISDEVHQIFSDGRSFQIMDIFIDTIGSITGIYIMKKIRK